MKIVHLCLSAVFIDNFSYQENIIAKCHKNEGLDVTVITSLYSYDDNSNPIYLHEASEYISDDGYKVIRLEYKKPIKLFRILRCYKNFGITLQKEDPDIIFIHNTSFFDINVVTTYLIKHPHVRVYADSHVDYINSAKNFLSKHILHKILWKYCTGKVVPYLTKYYGVTPLRCRFLKEMYNVPTDIIEYLPLGVDDDSIPCERSNVSSIIRSELCIPDDGIVLLTGGKIDKLKNTHVLLEALKRVNNSKLHLIICGRLSDEMAYLESSIRSNPNIHYLGWCDATRVMNCMVASDIACFPGTHSTLWEQSVGVGLPCIFKRWDEMEHVNVNGNCLFIKGDDIQELAAAIMKITDIKNISNFKELARTASKKFLYSNISKYCINENNFKIH